MRHRLASLGGLGVATIGLVLALSAPKHTVNTTPAHLPAHPFELALPMSDHSGEPPAASPTTVPATGRHGCPLDRRPGRLVIPSLCLDGPVVPAGGGRTTPLAVPADVDQVGLWTGGAPLVSVTGAPMGNGTTLIAGHVNHVGQGRGTLADLYQVSPAALVYLTSPAGVVTAWRVIGSTAV